METSGRVCQQTHFVQTCLENSCAVSERVREGGGGGGREAGKEEGRGGRYISRQRKDGGKDGRSKELFCNIR